MKNMKIQQAEGYLTVEAALILPMLIAAILFVIYILVFQYDRCLLEQDLGAMALWGSSVEEEDTRNLEEMAKERMRALYRDKYVAWEFMNLQARLEKNCFAAEGSGRLALPAFAFSQWSDGGIWRTGTTYEYRRLSPVAFIRLCRGLKNLVQENL